MGPAPGNDHPANRRLTAAAGLAGAQVNAVLKLKKPTFAIRIDVIRDRRAAQSDRVSQDLAQRNPQPVELGAGEAVGTASRTNASMKEAFIGVDIAYPGQQRLVEQSRLDVQAPTAKECSELAFANGQRFIAWRAKYCSAMQIAEFKAAKPTRIDET
jgi:hypothetical protein